jgi:hypothetical protein
MAPDFSIPCHLPLLYRIYKYFVFLFPSCKDEDGKSVKKYKYKFKIFVLIIVCLCCHSMPGTPNLISSPATPRTIFANNIPGLAEEWLCQKKGVVSTQHKYLKRWENYLIFRQWIFRRLFNFFFFFVLFFTHFYVRAKE